eukprot:TRINITY_DN6328_c0_g2_i1.p1 TRINITY_DN6328_c0_g2~~TRINITY_DN6328_c0_g2_i1.p1  ORF type:complete len:141 (-),score=36.30 TRINITY_DN6328_c0_g2_i1:55-477(-)
MCIRDRNKQTQKYETAYHLTFARIRTPFRLRNREQKPEQSQQEEEQVEKPNPINYAEIIENYKITSLGKFPLTSLDISTRFKYGEDKFYQPLARILLKEKKMKLVKEIIDEKKQEESKSCLLYTSPSPRDRQKSRMPSSA